MNSVPSTKLYKREVLDMDELRGLADNPMWDQGETEKAYRFPLPTDKDFSADASNLAKGIPEDQLYRVGQFVAAKSPNSHIGPLKWAIDFLVPDDTEILAAESGQIVEVVDSFTEWGPTEQFREKLNYLTIRHDNGEHSQYCHLAPNSFRETGLMVGDRIEKGQVIARVGKTGWTDRDHLHFIVFRVGKLAGSPYGFYSLRVRFDTQ
jgi:murein DD-endopeptidase MepM/ murein hydrolase activator NlpD